MEVPEAPSGHLDVLRVFCSRLLFKAPTENQSTSPKLEEEVGAWGRGPPGSGHPWVSWAQQLGPAQGGHSL